MTWMRTCSSNAHPNCQVYRHEQNRLKPTRLLYLRSDREDIIRLISVDKDSHYPYVTLSHRWGHPGSPKLSKNSQSPFSVSNLEAGILTSTLPEAFRDAIRVVQHLGLQYLWIDSLCIFQDSDSDWLNEAGKMGDVYAGGVFNVAVVNDKNSGGSAFPVQKEILLPMISTTVASMPPSFKSRTVMIPKGEFESEVMSSELLSRAWVYQEVLLAPANLFCAKEQMWWSCSGGTYSQTFPKGLQGLHIKGISTHFKSRSASNFKLKDAPRRAVLTWMGMLESYTGTSADDRLVAIAGLASVHNSLFPELLQGATYNSAVWSSDVPLQLLWEGRARSDSSLPATRVPTTHPMPSWSCVSYNGPIKYHGKEDRPMLPIKLMSLNSSGLDTFGRATDPEHCSLHLRGVLVPLTGLPPGPHGSSNPTLQSTVHPTGHPDAVVDISWDNTEELEAAAAYTSTNRDYVRAVLFQCHPRHGTIIGLLLRPSTGPKSGQGLRRWVRCGLLKKFVDSVDFAYYQKAFRVERYGKIFKREAYPRIPDTTTMSYTRSVLSASASKPIRHKPPQETRRNYWHERSIPLKKNYDDIFIV